MMALPVLILCALQFDAKGGTPAALLVADFDRDSVICEDLCINFYDRSSGAPTSWEWSFPGAVPDTSTVKDPRKICYRKAGLYTVRLIVSNGAERDTAIKSVRVRSQQIKLDAVIGGKGLIFDSMEVFTSRCDSIPISNASTIPLILPMPKLISGKAFSLTPDAFPLVIPPGETRKFQVCHSSTDTGEARDLIVLLDSCATIVVPLAGRTLPPLLKAGFGAIPGDPCGPPCFSFSDTTVGTPIRWRWSFPGATPDTSSERSPGRICYDSAGTFPVTLIVEGRFGRDTVVRTIEVPRSGLLSVLSEAREGEYPIEPTLFGTARCDSIVIANSGGRAYLVPSARMLDNRSFSAAPGQFPMIIPPGESRGVLLCYAPSSGLPERDTLVLEGCGEIAIPVTSRGIPGSSIGSVCETAISLRSPAGLDRLLRAASPYPNPGSGMIRLPVAVVRSWDGAGAECGVIDALGVEVMKGTYVRKSRRIDGTMIREDGEIAIDASGLPQGIYHAVISAGEERIVVPIVVRR